MENIRLIAQKELRHMGTCDASAAIAIDTDHFVVANDEDNVLKVYEAETSGGLVQGIDGRDLNDYFDNNPEKKEVDIEAGAKLGKTTYWITSHGADAKGKKRKERQQFFANKLVEKKGKKRFKQVGHSYTKLFKEILKDSRLDCFEFKDAGKLPPKEEGGFNIEGLTTMPNEELLIGFRNPIPHGKALLLPLKNPKELIKKKKAKPIFGEAIALDLNGLGIRSIEYWESQKRFIIIAGAYDGSDSFVLYQWSGQTEDQPQPLEVTGMPEGFRTESVLFYPEFPDRLQLLSDDGMVIHDGTTPCKEITQKDNPNKHFRSLWLKIEDTAV